MRGIRFGRDFASAGCTREKEIAVKSGASTFDKIPSPSNNSGKRVRVPSRVSIEFYEPRRIEKWIKDTSSWRIHISLKHLREQKRTRSQPFSRGKRNRRDDVVESRSRGGRGNEFQTLAVATGSATSRLGAIPPIVLAAGNGFVAGNSNGTSILPA